MDAALIIALLVGLLVGGVIAWLYASRESAAARQTVESLRLQLDGVLEERNAATSELLTLRTDHADAQAQIAALKAADGVREEAHRQQLAELKAAREALSAQFSEIGGKLLSDAQKAFLDRADARFHQAGEKSEEKLKNLLQPVEATLKRYEVSLGEIEKARNASYGELKQVVAQLTQGNDQVRRETQRLANVMVSSPKARGRWGEEQLRTILESAGLAENIDFVLQAKSTDEEGQQQQPDCVINLPGGRCIVVDVKCPLVAFEQAYDEQDEERRAAFLLQHASALRTYANDLGKKGYWQRFERSPDFVVMFIPGEHFLAAAAERAPKLIEDAYNKGVIVASTINMLALAKIMAGMWRQEALAAQAKEIAALGKELHARIQTMGSHVVSLGRNLRLATDNYDDFIGSLDAKVLTQAKRFEELKVADGNKPIVNPQRIDYTPKVSTKLQIEPTSKDEPPQLAAE